MSQLSFFSADLAPPRIEDLGGLLAAHGQISRGPSGVRLSILLDDEWRAESLVREFRARNIEAEVVPAAADLSAGLVEPGSERNGPVDGAALLRSRRTPELEELAADWTRGAVKAAPVGLTVAAGLLRCWTLAAGRHDGVGFLLGLDRHAPDTYEPLAAACARAGLAGALVGASGAGPALRIVGRRRHVRLVELLGTPPPEAPVGAFPQPAY